MNVKIVLQVRKGLGYKVSKGPSGGAVAFRPMKYRCVNGDVGGALPSSVWGAVPARLFRGAWAAHQAAGEANAGKREGKWLTGTRSRGMDCGGGALPSQAR